MKCVSPSKITNQLILILTFFLLLIIVLSNICLDSTMNFQTWEYTYSNALFDINNLIAIGSFFLIVACLPFKALQSNHSFKHHVILTIVTVFFSMLVWGILNPALSGDTYDVHQAALSWYSQGKPMDQYFSLYPYQFGLVQLLYFYMRLNPNWAISLFRLTNIFALIIIGNVLLDLTEMLTKGKGCTLFIVLYTLFFIPFLLVTFVYGDLIGLAFGLLSVLFYQYSLKEDHFKLIPIILSMFSLLIGIYFRLNTSIIGIGLIIYALINQNNFNNKILLALGYVFITIIGMRLGQTILNLIYHQETYNIPMIVRLAMGFDANGAGLREPGWYNGYTLKLVDQFNHNAELMSTQAIYDLTQSFHTFLSQPLYFLEFLYRKLISMFVLPDFEGMAMNFVSFENTYHLFGLTIPGSYLMFWITQFSKLSFLLISVGALIAIINSFHHYNNLGFFLVLFILGGIGYHMLFEAKARYMLPYVLLMIPLAISGFSSAHETFVSKFKNFQLPKATPLLITSICCILLVIDFLKTTLPVLYFEAYTDTQVKTPLKNQEYYRYPIELDEPISLTAISLQTYSNGPISDKAYMQISLYDESNNTIVSLTSPVKNNLNDSWTTFTTEPLRLIPGTYFLEISSNNPENQDYGIILGEQYSYINEDNILFNQFETELQGNIKIYR